MHSRRTGCLRGERYQSCASTSMTVARSGIWAGGRMPTDPSSRPVSTVSTCAHASGVWPGSNVDSAVDTMRTIRRNSRFKDLPIIAVTAKAMKGDREKTIQAGAWDYLAKPVDTEQMLSVLRSWLYR